MQTTHPNIFALKNSGLDAFLYADVGTEPNGSTLTILSMIARLGRDPWAEAANWATLPRAGAIESLVHSIAQMPLVPSALVEARSTAARLVRLLPTTTPSSSQSGAATTEALSVPSWLPVTLLYCAMGFGMALNVFLTPRLSQAVVTPAGRPMAVPGAGTGLPVHAEPVAGPAVARPGPPSR